MAIAKPDNLVALFEQSTKANASKPLFGTKNMSTHQFEWTTYGEVAKRVDNMRGGLHQLGVRKGDAIGIIANNRTEWAIAAFAGYGLGARFVPMYESEIFRTWQHIISDAGVSVLLVSTQAIFDEVKPLLNEVESLRHIYIIEAGGEQSMAHLEALGAKQPVQSTEPDPNDIACLIYTSGTTSDPKGVLLTHGNFVSNARAGYHKYQRYLHSDSISLSILPWAHSYGQTAELYNWFFVGGRIGFMHSIETLADDLTQVEPTFLIAVPRIFNRIYAGIHQRMEEQGGLQKRIFDASVKAAHVYREKNGHVGMGTRLMYNLGNKLVFSKIRARFGGNLFGSITASAKMNPEVSNFFADIGIPVFDCYGLSETSPAISMNSPDAHKLGSVGKPLELIQVRIDHSVVDDETEDGEIQVKGPNVMVGYHNKPEETETAFTKDGWLRTGDRGKLDEDGYLYVTGRLKEQYKLENGKYVFPSALEEDIVLLPYVETAMVYGDGKPYNVCLVVPDEVVLRKTAQHLEVKTDVKKLINAPLVQQFMSAEIRKSLKGKYGNYEIPKKFIFTDEHFTVENGTLTQTLKLKRRHVLAKYGDKLEALYED